MTEEDFRRIGYAVTQIIAKSDITLNEYITLSYMYYKGGASSKTVHGVYQGALFLNLEKKKYVQPYGTWMKISKNGHKLLLDIHNKAMHLSSEVEKTDFVD
jgi:hypothetical protein